MTTFRLKQIGLAFCLIASMLVGSAAACICEHHRAATEPVETSCHGAHTDAPNIVETLETPATGDQIDVNCVCIVDKPAASTVSRSESKKVKVERSVTGPDTLAPSVNRLTGTSLGHVSFDTLPISYSLVLKSLLPARAPPRL